MRESISLIFKGFIIGIGKIIPGVSGSLIAVFLGIYEKAIYIISNLFEDFKNNIIFLAKIGIGILLAIILGSNIIKYFLDNYYMPTMFLFIGLIANSMMSIKDKINKKNNLVVIIVAISSFILFLLKSNNVYNFDSLFNIFIIGFIDAFTMVVPGISGTAIFMLIGCYDKLLYIFSNLFSILFINPILIIMLGLGLIIGIIFTSKLMNYLLKYRSDFIYAVIFGFSISSVLYLLIKTINNYFNVVEFLISILLLLIGYIITKVFKHKIY